MPRFVDSSVWLFAAGAGHPLREPCRVFLDRSLHRGDRLHVSVEVLQEIVFHRLRRVGRDAALADVRDVRSAAVVHAFDEEGLDLALELMATSELRGRDAVHVAIARLAGCDEIVSVDADFGGAPGIRWIHPVDAA